MSEDDERRLVSRTRTLNFFTKARIVIPFIASIVFPCAFIAVVYHAWGMPYDGLDAVDRVIELVQSIPVECLFFLALAMLVTIHLLEKSKKR